MLPVSVDDQMLMTDHPQGATIKTDLNIAGFKAVADAPGRIPL